MQQGVRLNIRGSNLTPARRNAHVKSGCRTCKARKVKCDENVPACVRCVRSGRVCDGYGVWGGGGNFYGHRQPFVGRKNERIAANLSTIVVRAEEKNHFEWFRYRAVKKLPGLFVLSFWRTLLLQVCHKEPAVWHAVLTLSSVHRNEMLHGRSKRRVDDVPDEQEQLILQNYSKSIGHLQPLLSNKDLASIQIGLITCVVFVCLEFLRGHFKTAQTHLNNGIKVLREMHHPSCLNGDGMLKFKMSPDSTDNWIMEAFSRLQVQVLLLTQDYQDEVCFVLERSRPTVPDRIFESFNEAWSELERKFIEISVLAKQGREKLRPPLILLEHKEQIQGSLTYWLGKYQASRKSLQVHSDETFAFEMLATYHTMANIMTDTCLSPNDEMIYDSHTEQFIQLISHSINNWKIRRFVPEAIHLRGRDLNMSRSVIDIGWIPPLYYTAIKCRVRRVRVHAIRFLESTSHREGIWDAKIMACVARKVMSIEQRGLDEGKDTSDDFLLETEPTYRDLDKVTLPQQQHRIHDVKVVLPDGPTESIFLMYKEKVGDGLWKVAKREFNMLQEYWTDE